MGIIIATLNQKGGVGKSTLSFDIAAALAQDENKSVLLVDLDPQGHATEGIGLKELWLRKDIVTLYDGLMHLGKINPQDLIREVPGEKFFAIPSNFQMMELDKDLTGVRSRDTRLLDLLAVFRPVFDWIVIDSPSYFGNLTDNAIRAVGFSDAEQKDPDALRSGLVVPIQAEQTSVRALEILFDQIDVVQVELKVQVNQLAIVPNLVQESSLGRRILSDFRESLGDAVTPFNIPKRVAFQEAYDLGRTIFTYEPKDSKKLADVLTLRQVYLDLVAFLMKRGEEYATRFA